MHNAASYECHVLGGGDAQLVALNEEAAAGAQRLHVAEVAVVARPPRRLVRERTVERPEATAWVRAQLE